MFPRACPATMKGKKSISMLGIEHDCPVNLLVVFGIPHINHSIISDYIQLKGYLGDDFGK
jgi:hypothetical protein